MCLWSRIHMTHSVSHSMKLRRNIAETVNEVCYTTCRESSNSRPHFVSLYLLVSPGFVPLFRFPSLYRICLALCVWSIYSCGPIHFGGGATTYKWLGIQFGLLWKCDSGRFKGSQSSPEEAGKCLILWQFGLKHFPVGHESLSMYQWNPHNIYGRRHSDSS